MFYIGLDLGQRQDPSALAVVERRMAPVGGIDRATFEQPRELRLDVRHVERIRLGTSYARVAERVSEVLRWPSVIGQCTLVPDATGVGAAVLELLRPAALGCPVVPVTITGGDRAVYMNGCWRTPKRELMANMLVALETKQLRIAEKMREGRALVEEMIRMRVRITESAHEQFGAKVGAHDDLVLALALAVWRARSQEAKGMWGTRSLF